MSKIIGKYNSSITRVRPFFQQLIHNDSTGKSWIPKIINYTQHKNKLGITLFPNTGKLLPELSTRRKYKDRILKHYKIPQVELEECFENKLPPPYQFLKWLIMNPDEMVYDEKKISLSSKRTIDNRKTLFGKSGKKDQVAVQKIAIDELNTFTPVKSAGKWWAFEGFTEVDCYLETENLILLIEGKRTENISSVTYWYPQRNQIVRNLEVVREQAKLKNKNYAVLLMAEDNTEAFDDDIFVKSLPHLSNEIINELKKHYLGCLQWKDACDAIGIDFDSLPDTTQIAVNNLESSKFFYKVF